MFRMASTTEVIYSLCTSDGQKDGISIGSIFFFLRFSDDLSLFKYRSPSGFIIDG